MKKCLAILGLLFGIAGVGHAGIPQEATVNGSYYNSSVYGSSVPAAASAFSLAAPSSKNGVPGKYCLNNMQVVAANTVLVYFIDGSTTPTTTNNIALSGLTSSTANTLNTAHLEPICFTAGNSVGIYSTGASTITYAGYITYGGAGGSSVNAGN